MSYSEPEHDFAQEVLVSGDSIQSYTAAETLSRHDAVSIDSAGDVQIAPDGGGDFLGVVGYDTAQGEEAAIIVGDGNNEVYAILSESVTAGAALVPDGSGAFRQAVSADGETGVAVAKEDGGSGDAIQMALTSIEGTEA